LATSKNETHRITMNLRTIEKVIGKPTKIDWKKPKVIGSSSFYLKSFKAKNNSAEFIKENSKCSFEKYSNGILLRSNLSNKLSALPIKESEIKYIKLIRGKESVEPLTLSPMWIMLKFGVSKLIARYFKIILGEYSIDEMKLKIETENQIMEFTQNGYIFERQLSFFKNLNYGEKLIIEMNE
jgi:hypothetical protein